MRVRETYLGDGLYASFDDWQIMLRAPRENGDHVVFLEQHVLIAFLEFATEQGLITPRERAANVVANDREQDTTKSTG